MKFKPIPNNNDEVKIVNNLLKDSEFLYRPPNKNEDDEINTNKSNLDKTLWLLSRTKSFKKWFGDWIDYETNLIKNNNGLLDDNKEPLVVEYVKPTVIGYHFKNIKMPNDIYKTNNYYENKYFINTNNLLEISDISNWKEKFYLNLILYCYNININFLLDNMYFIINSKYYNKTDEEKKEIEKNIKQDISDLFNNNLKGDGKDLVYYFSNILINDNTVSLKIEADKTKLGIFLKKLAKYIINPGEFFTYDDFVFGMENIIKLNGIKYLNNLNEYEYLIFNKNNIRCIFNNNLNTNNDKILETKYIKSFLYF